ncbi:flagellar export chaperone FliS [Halonatronum saccharophilum]|uniref:flagellar export chaperone FliS n=1 Tax=Halonatronum saccharophilum TaxID=150060 RepID=UPI000483C3F4|nr:flagellar export chaperone FliS [Halonatronum saccharophilum]
MLANNPYQKYKSTKYETASPEKLLLMLYEGGIRFAKRGKIAMEKKDIQEVNKSLQKVQQVINELMVTLNMDKGGEISQNLYSLYEYINRRLIEANIKKDPLILDEVINLLTELKEGWEEASKKVNNNKRVLKGGGMNIEG